MRASFAFCLGLSFPPTPFSSSTPWQMAWHVGRAQSGVTECVLAEN